MVERDKVIKEMRKYPMVFIGYGARQGERIVKIRYQQKREPNYVYDAKIKNLREEIQKSYEIVGSGQQMGGLSWYWIIKKIHK